MTKAELNKEALDKVMHIDGRVKGLEDQAIPRLYDMAEEIQKHLKTIGSDIKQMSFDVATLKRSYLKLDRDFEMVCRQLAAAGSAADRVGRPDGIT
jgi:archaellum component FlaC